ncbi:MAG TPA: hypothetical protein PLZ38_13150, partial [Spirochaetota bacterium]|nr:hypothetical protein [Spirochaetota bacterium]
PLILLLLTFHKMLFKRSPAADCRDLLIIFMSNKNNPNPPNKVIPIENPFTQNLMRIKNSSKKML